MLRNRGKRLPRPTITEMTLGGRESLRPEAVAQRELPQERLDRDRQLVDAILRKDRKAAAEFVDVYADALYTYLRGRLTPRIDLVDDLVQDVFVAALGSLPRYAGQSSLRAWLLGIARHKVEDYVSRAAPPGRQSLGVWGRRRVRSGSGSGV